MIGQEGKPIRWVSIGSGTGITAYATGEATKPGGILHGLVEPAGFIASRVGAKIVDKAKSLDIPWRIIDRRDFPNGKEGLGIFGIAITNLLKDWNPDIVTNNGLLAMLPKNAVLYAQRKGIAWANQHPATLDPDGELDFGGRKMFGLTPILAELIFNWIENTPNPTIEATLHHVTAEEQYDKGDLIRVEMMALPTLGQKVMLYDFEQDQDLQHFSLQTASEVQRKLLSLEHQNMIFMLAELSETRELPRIRRGERLIKPGQEENLIGSKRLAIHLFPKE